MSDYLSQRPHEYNKYVPVIASFSNDGRLKPLYIEVNGESYRIIKVVENWNTSQVITYKCQIENYGKIQDINLLYSRQDLTWKLNLKND